MPWRLYRFTTERRTSVNRYLLTLDFPWPPPPSPCPNSLVSTLAAANPLQRHRRRRVLLASSRFLLPRRRRASSTFLLPTFRRLLRAPLLPPPRRSPPARVGIGGEQIAVRRKARGSYENI